eukprot:11387211-Ditylum_brightwellii.AAC.1
MHSFHMYDTVMAVLGWDSNLPPSLLQSPNNVSTVAVNSLSRTESLELININPPSCPQCKPKQEPQAQQQVPTLNHMHIAVALSPATCPAPPMPWMNQVPP